MASYLLYILTGAVLALMAGRHLRGMLRALPAHLQDSHMRLNIFHGQDHVLMHWAEATLGAAILLFGLWLMLTAGVLFASGLLHSFS
jgi:hypothetical protein